jgi:hypothetical protein
MHLRRWSSALVVPVAVVLLAAPAAAQGPPDETPAGGGCRENGEAVSGFARMPGAFGQFVQSNAPIADDNAAFFVLFCSG